MSAPSHLASDMPVVMHVRSITGFGGGPEKTILNSPRYLKPLGFESFCAYLYPENDPGMSVLKQRAHSADAELLPIVDRGALDLSLVPQFRRIAQERGVKIWHAHDDKTNFLGLFARRKGNMKLVTTTHGWVSKSRKLTIYKTISRLSLKYYDAVIAVSPDLDDTLKSWGIPAERRFLIENAIDTSDFRRTRSTAEARVAFAQPANGIVLAALGRLAPEKGLLELVEAVAIARKQGTDVSLWIGGEGKLRESLHASITQHELTSHVHLLGHLPDPKLMLQAADVFVLSSIREGLPNVVLEAMALETPVISTRVAGVPRVITHEEHGLLVDIGEQSQLVAAITRMAQDAALRERLAKQARRRIEENYDFRNRMQKIAAVYQQVLAAGR